MGKNWSCDPGETIITCVPQGYKISSGINYQYGQIMVAVQKLYTKVSRK
jgi:hypothetical protein